MRKNAGGTGDVGSDALKELALDLRWSWYHGSDELWSQLDPELWALTHNPWLVLQTASPTRVGALVARPAFRKWIERLLAQRREYLDSAAWFQQHHAQTPLSRVAYFSMEFALSEALPIYSGGLGNVAGDQLKAASDLAVPVVGVGLLYQQGYFRQMIAADGSQEELYPYNEPAQLPITPVRGPGGEWLRLSIQLPGYTIWLRAWQVQVGRVVLYLLDSNDPANPPAVRGIASELYGADRSCACARSSCWGSAGGGFCVPSDSSPRSVISTRGMRPSRSWSGPGPSWKRAASPSTWPWRSRGPAPCSPPTPRWRPASTASPSSLVERYLGRYAQKRLGIEPGRLLALGRERPDDPDEPFNMAYLAIRGSAAVNGVSRLHGAVSRHLLQSLFPRWPEIEVPVAHVTNGVHTPTWDSAEADALWTRTCGAERWRGTMETIEQGVACASDEELWAMRADGRKALVAYVRERMTSHVEFWDTTPDEAEALRACLDPDALTLGFARRFATYKRPNLLLHDPDRLLRLLSNRERPVHLVMAGKAHPADEPGQDLIREWIRFIRRPEVQGRVIFLPDYDLLTAEHLVQGVDLWINTPRRPWEASGTSGMKVLVNGGLNLSELDGWWAEAYTPEVGWALGDGREHGDRSRVGCGGGRGPVRRARARGGARVLRARRAGHSRRLDRQDAREHGAPDAAVLREPGRARVHGDVLPAARFGLSDPSRRPGPTREPAGRVATGPRRAVAGGALRCPPRGDTRRRAPRGGRGALRRPRPGGGARGAVCERGRRRAARAPRHGANPDARRVRRRLRVLREHPGGAGGRRLHAASRPASSDRGGPARGARDPVAAVKGFGGSVETVEGEMQMSPSRRDRVDAAAAAEPAVAAGR